MAESFFRQDFLDKSIRPVYHYALTFFQFDMDMHTHPAVELMYVAGNQCTIRFPSHSLVLKKGELIFIDAGVPHQLYIEKGKECRVLNLELEVRPYSGRGFSRDFFAVLQQNQGFQKLRETTPAYFVVPDDGSTLKQSMDMIQQSLYRKTNTGTLTYEISAMLFLLLSLLCQRYAETVDTKTGMASFVSQAMRYIEVHYNEALSVEQLAKSCCVSKSHLQRAFRMCAGKTLVQVIQEKRVEKAKMLLRSSNLAIIDVAVETGFNNRQHFTETFTKIVGISPSDYRKSKGNMLGAVQSQQLSCKEGLGSQSLSYVGCPAALPQQEQGAQTSTAPNSG